jgi:F-type H+-transporting ATPase subunit b
VGDILRALDIEPKAILIQIVGFLVLLWLLKRFLFGPISAVLASRQEEIKATYEKMAQDKAAMDASRAELERRLASMDAEARERIQAAIKEAQRMKDEIVSDARKQSERIVETGREEVRRERDKALVALREEVADLAVAAASKIIQANLDETRNRQLVAEFIKNVGS